MLKRLVVQNLRGYEKPELEIRFNSDLNLVTGRNGAGKTTLLKLAWYLISGNIHIAAEETPFSLATIETDDYSMTVDLTDSMGPQVFVDVGGQETIFKRPTTKELDALDLADIDDDDTLTDAGSLTEDFGRSFYLPTFRRVEGGYDFDFDRPVSHILDPVSSEFTLEGAADIAAWTPDEDLVSRIQDDYQKLLRGKTWFAVLKKYLCASTRGASAPA